MNKGKINISNWLDSATHGLAWVAGVFLLLLMLYVTGDVIGRYIFNSPLPGAYELATTLLAFIVFLGLAFGEKAGVHIRLVTLPEHFGKRTRLISDIAANLVGICLFGLITHQSWVWAFQSALRGEYMEGQINFPFYPSKFATALGITFMLIIFIAEFIKRMIQIKRKADV